MKKRGRESDAKSVRSVYINKIKINIIYYLLENNKEISSLEETALRVFFLTNDIKK